MLTHQEDPFSVLRQVNNFLSQCKNPDYFGRLYQENRSSVTRNPYRPCFWKEIREPERFPECAVAPGNSALEPSPASEILAQ